MFSTFSAKSAVVNRCCRNLLPNTYTGSLPRVAVSEKVTCGRRKDRASFTSAEAALVSASAALRSGFFSSAMLTACCSVSGEGCCVCCAKSNPGIDNSNKRDQQEHSLQSEIRRSSRTRSLQRSSDCLSPCLSSRASHWRSFTLVRLLESARAMASSLRRSRRWCAGWPFASPSRRPSNTFPRRAGWLPRSQLDRFRSR